MMTELGCVTLFHHEPETFPFMDSDPPQSAPELVSLRNCYAFAQLHIYTGRYWATTWRASVLLSSQIGRSESLFVRGSKVPQVCAVVSAKSEVQRRSMYCTTTSGICGRRCCGRILAWVIWSIERILARRCEVAPIRQVAEIKIVYIFPSRGDRGACSFGI